MNYFFVFLGGGLGSLARFLTTKFAQRYISSDFPVGTFIANVIACFLLAVLVISFSHKENEFPWIQPLLIVGFCGGFSTFSTFSNETFALMENGHGVLAFLNIALSVVVGVGLIYFIRTRA